MRNELAYIAARAHIEELHRRAAAERLAAGSRGPRQSMLSQIHERLVSHRVGNSARTYRSRLLTGSQLVGRR